MEFKSGAGSQDADAFEVIEIDFQTLCRLCGNVNDQLISIFEDEGAENDLSDKLLEYLPMKITQSDELPKKMCIQCTNSILVWHDFVCACIEADKKLTNMIAISDIYQQQNQKEATEKSQNPKSKLAHIDILKTTDPSNLQEIRKIQYLVDNEDNGQFEALNDMEEDSQDFIKIKETYPESEIDDEKPQCSKAQQISKPTNDTVDQGCPQNKNHQTKPTSSTMKPPKIQFLSTITNVPSSSDKQTIKCQFCDQQFDTKSILFDHYKDQHCDLVFHCEQCGDYLDRNDLIAHMIGHAMSGMLGSSPTEDAPATTSLKERDKEETPRNNGDTTKPKVTTKCHLCDEHVGPKQMTAHFKAVHKHLDKNECPECNSQFSCRRLLINHIKAMHETKREYKCSECFKCFKVQSNLYQHKQTHANSPNFQCAYCDKTFHFRVNLKNHLLVHTKNFTYECTLCKKKFTNPNNLSKHVLVHKTDTFSCHMCDFICKQRRYLDEHIKRRHRRAI